MVTTLSSVGSEDTYLWIPNICFIYLNIVLLHTHVHDSHICLKNWSSYHCLIAFICLITIVALMLALYDIAIATSFLFTFAWYIFSNHLQDNLCIYHMLITKLCWGLQTWMGGTPFVSSSSITNTCVCSRTYRKYCHRFTVIELYLGCKLK